METLQEKYNYQIVPYCMSCLVLTYNSKQKMAIGQPIQKGSWNYIKMLTSSIYLQALFLRAQISGVEMQESTLNIKKG